MRSAKDWFEDELSGEPLTQESVIEVIKMIQEEVIEETCNVCANNAKLLFHDGFWKKNSELEYYQSGENNLQISKESILKCIKILKDNL